MKIYENIVIGNFLFDLGVRMGKAAPGLPLTGVNLMQQSPWDEKIGDVLLSNASIFQIIEFKRKKNSSKKEIQKHTILKNGIAKSDGPRYFEALSREVHWYVEIDDVGNDEIAFEIRVVPYLDFVNPSKYIEILQFAEATARQACRRPLPKAERLGWHKYLKFVVAVNDAAGVDVEAEAGAGSGALVLTTTSEGELKWIAAKELRYLFMTRRELELELKIDLGPELKQEIGHEIDPGFGFSM